MSGASHKTAARFVRVAEARSNARFFHMSIVAHRYGDDEELAAWQQKSGLPLQKFFNTSGRIYKENHLKDKLPAMSDEEKLDLLSSDGMLIKRPILLADDGSVLVGFKEAQWESLIG